MTKKLYQENSSFGSTTGHAVSRRFNTTEAWVESCIQCCGICGGRSSSERRWYPNTSISPSQYHATTDPRPFICLFPTLCNLSHRKHRYTTN